MPPLSLRDLTRRNANTSRTFSIIFVLIAALVVAACILWGYYLPKWRHKYRGPSSTRFNCIGRGREYSSPSQYTPRFPSHPGVRGMRKNAVRDLPRYNPRSETPFASTPHLGETLSLHDLSPTRVSQQSLQSRYRRPTHDHQLSITPATFSMLALKGVQGRSMDENDDKMPELPAPIARPAGRAPPLTKRLALFPMPASTSIRSLDPMAHSKVVFANLDGYDPPNTTSVVTSTSRNAPPKHRVTLQAKRCGDNRKKSITQDAEAVKSDVGEIVKIRKEFGRRPIDTIRTRYDRSVARVKFVPSQNASLRRHQTPSTEPLTACASVESDFAAIITPPTSPPPPANTPVLLPTPLRLRRAALRAASGSPTPVQAWGKSLTQSSVAILPGNIAPFALQKDWGSKRNFKENTSFCYPISTQGDTAAQLRRVCTVIPNSTWSSLRLDGRSPPISSTFKEHKETRNSWKGSSVYSQDAKGMGVMQSPLFDFEGGEENSTSPVLQNNSPKRASSMELVRSKIDDWNLHTGNLELSILPLTSSYRPLSDVGPRSPIQQKCMDSGAPLTPRGGQAESINFRSAMRLPKICIGRPSDDVFGDGGNVKDSGGVLRRVLNMELASSETTGSAYLSKTAPGGAEWI